MVNNYQRSIPIQTISFRASESQSNYLDVATQENKEMETGKLNSFIFIFIYVLFVLLYTDYGENTIPSESESDNETRQPKKNGKVTIEQLAEQISQLMYVCKDLVGSVTRIEMRLQRIEEKIIPNAIFPDDEAVEDLIQLSTVKDVDEFESNLEERMFRKKMVTKLFAFNTKSKFIYTYLYFQTEVLARIGGKSSNNNLKKIFVFLFPNFVLQEFSWRGTAQKKAFNEYKNIKRLISDAVKANHKSFTIHDYEDFAKPYLRHAKWRKVFYFNFFLLKST